TGAFIMNQPLAKQNLEEAQQNLKESVENISNEAQGQ
ncbi:CvpA family protein, partial [Campylobacter upsaliensis]|nr:CvpA family protein [Campylobacter upsaliensis]